MKNTLFFFAILAFSINAFPQGKRPAHFKQSINPGSFKNAPIRMESAGLKTSKLNPEHEFKHELYAARLDVQVFDSLLFWRWDTINTGWKLNYKIADVVYDINGNLTNSTDYRWNGSAWEKSAKTISTFDGNSNEIAQLSQNWSGNAWVNYNQYIWTYDANHHETSVLIKNWENGKWENLVQTFQAYNANNSLATEVSQSWNNGAWENSYKITYTYDAHNNLTNVLNLVWNTGAWENSSQDSYTFDANNNNTIYLTQFWLDNKWIDLMKTIYTYDANNRLISELSLDKYDIEWVNSYQSTYSYDAHHNLISETVQDWNGTGWDNSELLTYTYDANNNENSFLVQFWNEGNWQNVYQSRHAFDENNLLLYSVALGWNMEGNAITSGDNIYAYYHIVATTIPGLAKANIYVYPNPTSGKLIINSFRPITAIEVYNLSGKLIYSDFNVKQQTLNEIDLSGYVKGIYFVKIYNRTKFYNRKVVVQ